MKIEQTTEKFFTTTDYDNFHFLPKGWNRPINEHDVNEIVSKISTFGYINSKLGSIWIDVDGVFGVRGRWYIVDAQHRFRACQIKKIPFPYNFYTLPNEKHLTPDEKRHMISSLVKGVNVTQHSWKISYYINQNAVAGSKFYQEVVKFRDTNNYPERASVACICGTSKVTTKKIQDGYEYPIVQEWQSLNPRNEFVSIVDQCSKKITYAKKEDWIFAVIEFVNRYITEPKYRTWKRNLIDNCNTILEQRSIQPYLIAFDNTAGIPKEKKWKFTN